MLNQIALTRHLDELLPLYQSWGVAGLKFGFVTVGSQPDTTWLHQAVAKCAEHHLMVDIHDEYRPTGVSRTWPNLLTQEGIRGDEESPTNAVVLDSLFTRCLAGAADPAAAMPTKVLRTSRPVDRQITLSLDLAPNHGFAIIIAERQP